MSATFNKMMIVGTSVLALLVMASGAAAAPSLGLAKGRPYYGSSNRASGFSGARSYAPAFSTETRQSFSYEPAEGAAKATGGCQPHAAAPQAVKSDTTKDDVAAAPKVTRRSYSYEPAAPAPQRRVYSGNDNAKKEPWQFQKTDPRRMGR